MEEIKHRTELPLSSLQEREVLTQTRGAFIEREYREAYAASELDTLLAMQIRVLREQRGWTQAQLAERAGMKQARISAMEDVNYQAWSVRTLKRLAAAFDLPLMVSFGDWLRVGIGHGRKGLERDSFDAAIAKAESAPSVEQQESEKPPLVDYMTTDSRQQRCAAFLRTYAERLRNGTAASWEIQNTVASTLEDIANVLASSVAAPPVAGEDHQP